MLFVASALIIFYCLAVAVIRSDWNRQRLYRTLVEGGWPAKLAAASDLAYLGAEEELLDAMQSRSPGVRRIASVSLTHVWVRSSGKEAAQALRRAEEAVAGEDLAEAEAILRRLLEAKPAYAEGWVHWANLHWTSDNIKEALSGYERALKINPRQFTGWQNLGLCYLRLGEPEKAYGCLRQALRLTPHDSELQEWVKECRELLQWLHPEKRYEFDLV